MNNYSIKISFNMMSIQLSKESKEYLEKNNASNFLVDIIFIEEPCTQIYHATIEEIEEADLEKYKDFENVSKDNLILYLSDWFLKIYGKLEEFQLDVDGFFKKKLIIKNVNPIIKNTCKI